MTPIENRDMEMEEFIRMLGRMSFEKQAEVLRLLHTMIDIIQGD